MSRVKRAIGRVVNPMAQVTINRENDRIVQKRPRISQLKSINRFLSAPRRGVHLTSDERVVRNKLSRKGKLTGFR